MLKHAYERAVANAKELGDLIQRSNGEAIGLLNARFAEAMEEVKGADGEGGQHEGLIRWPPPPLPLWEGPGEGKPTHGRPGPRMTAKG